MWRTQAAVWRERAEKAEIRAKKAETYAGKATGTLTQSVLALHSAVGYQPETISKMLNTDIETVRKCIESNADKIEKIRNIAKEASQYSPNLKHGNDKPKRGGAI